MRLETFATFILLGVFSFVFADSTQVKVRPNLKPVLPNSVPDASDCVSNDSNFIESKDRTLYTGTAGFGQWQQVTCPIGYVPYGFRASVFVTLGHNSSKWSYYCCRLKGQYLS